MKNLLIAACAALVALTACTKEEEVQPTPETSTGSMTLKFDPYWGEDAFSAGNTYTNAFSEAFTPTTFKYYISNVSLEKISGETVTLDNTYFLVDNTNGSVSWTLDGIEEGEYSSFTFAIGVDSAKTMEGVQEEGPLAAENQMSWNWNTGYIFYKLEGNSPASAETDNAVRYHIGGFKSPNNALRWVHQSFATDHHGHLKSEGAVEINPNATPSVHFHVQVDALFNQANSKSIAERPKHMAPNEVAGAIADLYKNMFVVDHVHE